MSIAVTQGQALVANIPYASATANDNAQLLIYVNNSIVYSFLSKEDEAEKKLTIEAGVGYSFTLSANKTRFLKDTSTYKLYRNNVLIVSGTIAVTITETEPAVNKVVASNYFICDELPEVSMFAEGTIVSVGGVLYVKKDGAWASAGAKSVVVEGTIRNDVVNIDMTEILELGKTYSIACVFTKDVDVSFASGIVHGRGTGEGDFQIRLELVGAGIQDFSFDIYDAPNNIKLSEISSDPVDYKIIFTQLG